MSYEEIGTIIDVIISLVGLYAMMIFFDYIHYRLYIRHYKIYRKIFGAMPPFKIQEQQEKIREIINIFNRVAEMDCNIKNYMNNAQNDSLTK